MLAWDYYIIKESKNKFRGWTQAGLEHLRKHYKKHQINYYSSLIFYSKILIFFYRLISYLKINEQMLLDFVKVLQQEIILFLLKFV